MGTDGTIFANFPIHNYMSFIKIQYKMVKIGEGYFSYCQKLGHPLIEMVWRSLNKL